MSQAMISRGPRSGRHAAEAVARAARRPAARGAFLAMRAAPVAVQILIGTVMLVIVWAAVNWIVQVVRKPAEVFVRGQRVARQGAGADVAAIRPALRRAFHRGHHTGIAGRSGPGREQRQSGRTDLLAVAVQLESVRALPRPRAPSGCFRSPMERSQRPGAIASRITSSSRTAAAWPAVVPVQRALHTGGARACGGDDRRAAGSHGRAHPRPQPAGDRVAAAAAEPRGDHPPVRETAPVTATRAGASDSPAASDAATTTPAATLPRSTR